MTQVLINKADADTPGADNLEFVELYDGGTGSTDLTGLVVVFHNGSTDASYAAFDLDGYNTDANGYFVLGNAAVTGVDLVFSDGTLQNGGDAVTLYVADATASRPQRRSRPQTCSTPWSMTRMTLTTLACLGCSM